MNDTMARIQDILGMESELDILYVRLRRLEAIALIATEVERRSDWLWTVVSRHVKRQGYQKVWKVHVHMQHF